MTTTALTKHSLDRVVSSRTPISIVETKRSYAKLCDSWSFYYHLPDDNRWDLGSYTCLMSGIDHPEKLISINEVIPEVIIKNAMLFVMRAGINPMWEDERNRHGGYLSFKVLNKCVHQVWKTMFYAVCGETLFVESENNSFVNGISISPKKTFCIIKVWLSNGKVKDAVLMPVPMLATGPEDLKYTAFQAQLEADASKN